MLHEILLALLGIPGNLIIEEEDCFKISPFINFLTESEKELINRLIIMGFYYKRIVSFLDFNSQMISQSVILLSPLKNI